MLRTIIDSMKRRAIPLKSLFSNNGHESKLFQITSMRLENLIELDFLLNFIYVNSTFDYFAQQRFKYTVFNQTRFLFSQDYEVNQLLCLFFFLFRIFYIMLLTSLGNQDWKPNLFNLDPFNQFEPNRSRSS